MGMGMGMGFFLGSISEGFFENSRIESWGREK
jgi:hypothetical protein